MGRGARVTPEEVADYKDRAARLEAVRAKDKKKYPGATWDYLADTSPRPAQTIMKMLQGFYDSPEPNTDRRDSLEQDRPTDPPKSSRPQGGGQILPEHLAPELPDLCRDFCR